MTISSSSRKAGPYLGNDTATSFDFEFKVFTDEDVAVTLTSGGAETTLGIDADYSVALNVDQDDNPGGTVTYPLSGDPLANGEKLTITCDLPELQPTELTNGGGFYPKVIENALDRVVIYSQQLREEMSRTMQIAISDENGSGAYRARLNRIQDLADPTNQQDAANRRWVEGEIGRLLANGNGQYVLDLLAATSGAALVGGVAQVVSSIAALRALSKTSASKAAIVTSYYGDGAGGGGAYRLDLADTTSVDNGGSIIVANDGGRWKLVFTGEYWIEQFGAKAGTDSTTAFLAAVATGKPLRVGHGDFTISAPISFSQRIQCSGEDDGQTAFTFTGTGQFILNDWNAKLDGCLMKSGVNSKTYIKCPGMSYFHLTNFRIEKIGAASGQIGIDFDCTTASIYFCSVDHGRFKVDYPIRISGVLANNQVFNANNIGTNPGTLYFQNFLSAITIDGTLACDANNFAGYFETGVNIISHVTGALRGNNFDFLRDAVTNHFNGGVAVADENEWALHGVTFTFAGTYPQNQKGVPTTKLRATDVSGLSIANATETDILFATELFDTLTEFAAGVFTAKSGGYYRYTARATSSSVAWTAAQRWELKFYKGGTLYDFARDIADGSVTERRTAAVGGLVYLNAGETLKARVIHNRGSATTLDTTDTPTAQAGNHFDVEYVGRQ